MPEHEVGYWPSSFLRCYGPRQSQSPEKKTKACIRFFLHLNPQFIYFFLHPNHNSSNRSHEGLTLETSAFKLFTVANLRYQLS